MNQIYKYSFVSVVCAALVASAVFSGESIPTSKIQINNKAATLLASPAAKDKISKPQFVLLSFDGSKSIKMWQDTRGFAKEMNAKGKPLHFTYFINSIYFITKENADLYKSPREKVGVSRIGFADSKEDIVERIKQVSGAIEEGNEIGSHSAGHFNGSEWNYEEWQQEFISFENLLFGAQKNNPDIALQPLPIIPRDVVGFRAPELGVNNDLYKTLQKFNFLYDASGVALPGAQPKKDEYGIWHIPLNTIHIGKDNSPAVAMDYSLWMHQSQGQETAHKGTLLWDEYFNEVEKAYMEDFNENYKGGRGPIVIGHHFSLWNDGVYWEAMKSFAEEVCGMKDVRCTTFREYVSYLNSINTEPLVKNQ
ncbi:MAG: hypothetical protein WCO12_03390 [bacterium]